MLRTFVFHEDKNSWIEESQLLLHDIGAFLDEEKKKIYLWKGPKSTQEKLEKGYQHLLSSYKDKIQIMILNEKIPSEIKEKVDEMLNSIIFEEEASLGFSRLSTIRLYFVLTLFLIILSVLNLLNLMRYVNWSNLEGKIVINATNYEIWLNISIILILICLIIFIINLIIGIVEIENQVITFSSIGVLICTGILLYLTQGIFLFLFQERSTSKSYVILQNDMLLFFILNCFAVLLYLIPNSYKIITFAKNYREYIF